METRDLTTSLDQKEFCPLGYLQQHPGDIAVMILNQPSIDVDLMKYLWTKAKVKVAVDGGTNVVFDGAGRDRDGYIPDLICGDFDSIRTEVSQFYKTKGVEFQHTPDQDYVDAAKALRLINVKFKVDLIVVLGGFGGRMDQIFANLDVLYQAKRLTNIPVVLVSKCQMCMLLYMGVKHHLKVDTGWEGDWCGLIPVGRPCYDVTTTGLKWNLDKEELEFGRLISTSNKPDGTGLVTVQSDSDLLWCMEVKRDVLMK